LIVRQAAPPLAKFIIPRGSPGLAHDLQHCGLTCSREALDKSQARAACDLRDGAACSTVRAATKPSGKFQIPADGKTPYADGMKFAISVSPFFGNATQVNSLWAKRPIEMLIVP
jgi:hypothetical protein